jgi:hypothetical protein
MTSGKIPGDAITASSQSSSSYKPSNARLTIEGSSCSWAPTDAGKIGSWLQVDLGQLTTVTGIATQGSCYNAIQRAKSYSVSYSNQPNSWIPYEESGNVKVSQRIILYGEILQNTDSEINIKARLHFFFYRFCY